MSSAAVSKEARDILEKFRGRAVGINHAFDLVHGDQVIKVLRTGHPKVPDCDILDHCMVGCRGISEYDDARLLEAGDRFFGNYPRYSLGE